MMRPSYVAVDIPPACSPPSLGVCKNTRSKSFPFVLILVRPYATATY